MRNIIRKCFVHIGFQPGTQLAANCMSDEEDRSLMVPPSIDSTAAWAALRDSITIDGKAIAHEELSNKTVIESVQHSDASSGDGWDEQDLTSLPRVQEVVDTFDVMHKFCWFPG